MSSANSWPPTREAATLTSIGALAGMLISAVGGSWYVSSAIAEEGQRARTVSTAMVKEHREQVADVYARREDMRELQTKLDIVISLQKRIIEKLERE